MSIYNKEDVKGKIRDLRDVYSRFNHEYWSSLLEDIPEEDERLDIIYNHLINIEPMLKALYL